MEWRDGVGNGGMVEWQEWRPNGGMVQWQEWRPNGGMAEWQEWWNGGMVEWHMEWRNGGMAEWREWRNCRNGRMVGMAERQNGGKGGWKADGMVRWRRVLYQKTIIKSQIKKPYLSKVASTDKHIVTQCIPSRFEFLQNSLNKYPVIRDKFIPKFYRYFKKKVTTFFVEIAFW